jgi:hypothetical protein
MPGHQIRPSKRVLGTLSSCRKHLCVGCLQSCVPPCGTVQYLRRSDTVRTVVGACLLVTVRKHGDSLVMCQVCHNYSEHVLASLSAMNTVGFHLTYWVLVLRVMQCDVGWQHAALQLSGGGSSAQ